jgi:hypothetical protein
LKALRQADSLRSALLTALLLAPPTALHGAEASGGGFALVKDGKPAATVVIAGKPSKTALFAVEELNSHIEKITGTRLPVVSDGTEVTGPRVLVGESAATRALGLRSSDFREQEYLVRATPDTLILLGRDDDRPPPPQSGSGWTRGKWGSGYAFDNGPVFTVKNHGYDDAEGTLECWLLVDDAGSGTILRLSSPTSHAILMREGNRVRCRSIAAGKEETLVSEAMSVGWHHVRATHSAAANRIELFVDGKSQGAAPYRKTSVGQSPLFVGGFFADHNEQKDPVLQPLKGVIDELRVSKSVRQGVPAGPFTADEHTTFLSHLDENAGVPVGLTDHAGNLLKLPGMFEARGTLDAVYDLLFRCGVRWYAPGELGRVVERRPTLAVPALDRRRSPSMEYREIPIPMMFPERPDNPYARYDQMVWLLRLHHGGKFFMQGTHSFYGFIDRFSKTYGKNPAVFEADRPEFFAQGLAEGQMRAAGVPGGMPNLCYSSDALVAQVAQDARDFFDGKGLKPGSAGRGDYYAIGPMDMAPDCKCPACTKAIRPPKDVVDRGTHSDYWFGFVNKVAREVGRTLPGKWITVLAYYRFLEPPGFPLEPNVSVTICQNDGPPTSTWDPARAERERRSYDRWVELMKGRMPLYVWTHYCYVSPSLSNGFPYPNSCTWRTPEYMEKLRRDGIRGMFIQHGSEFNESFLLSQMELYLSLQLGFDAELDGAALAEEFFPRYYGPAGELMRQLYWELAEVKFNLQNYPEEVRKMTQYNSMTPDIACHLLTPDRVERWGKLLDQALAATTGVERERVRQYKAGVWDRMMQNRIAFLSQEAK